MRQGRDDPNSPQALLLQAIPRLQRFCYAMTGSREDGEDLGQIALERAIANLHRWTPGTRMEPWVLRIAYNAWIDEVRACSRRGKVVAIDDMYDLSLVDGRDVVESTIDLKRTRAAMDALPDDHRVILTLVAIEGMSYQEVSEILKIPIGTVMSRLSRARKAVAQKLQPAGSAVHE